jgi:hypothetical protein
MDRHFATSAQLATTVLPDLHSASHAHLGNQAHRGQSIVRTALQDSTAKMGYKNARNVMKGTGAAKGLPSARCVCQGSTARKGQELV